jgi:hypothetical protein
VAITDLKVQSFQSPVALASFVAGGGIPAKVKTGGNVFPMELEGETLLIEISTDGGATYAAPVTHTFLAGSGTDHSLDVPPGPDQTGFYMSIEDVVADIVADGTFMADLVVYAEGDELVIKTAVAGNRAIRVDATSSGIGAGLLQFLSDQVGNGAVTTIQQIVVDNNGQFVIFFL